MEQISDVTSLLKRVKELEEEVGLLKHDLVIQQNINFEWSGNLGRWNWNVKEDIVEFNNKKVEALGYNRSELPEKISELMNFSFNNKQPGTEGELGTGLGLTLCRDFIHKNSGTITIESKRGTGTTVSFTLPLLKQGPASLH